MKVLCPRISRKPIAIALAAGLTAGLSPSVLAQNTSERTAILEEVVVTARKVAESMQDVSVAVTAFSGETMDALMLRDVREMEAMALHSASAVSSGPRAWRSATRSQAEAPTNPTSPA